MNTVNNYNSIRRSSISTVDKQDTVNKFESFIKSHPDVAAKVLINLIRFKNERKLGNIVNQNIALKNLEELSTLHKVDCPSYDSLIKLVRNTSYIFQRNLPGNFTTLINKLITNNDPILLDLTKHLSEHEITFLNNSHININLLKTNVIKKLFKKLELRIHPDKNGNSKASQVISAALHNIKDIIIKQNYQGRASLDNHIKDIDDNLQSITSNDENLYNMWQLVKYLSRNTPYKELNSSMIQDKKIPVLS